MNTHTFPHSAKENELSELFKNASKKQLESFLIAYAVKHPGFAGELEDYRLPRKKEKSPVDYNKEVRKCFSKANSSIYNYRYGHTDPVADITDGLYDLTEKARFFMKKGLFEDALAITLSVMEEVADSYEEYYDHDGDLASSCQDAAAIVEEILQRDDVPEELTGYFRSTYFNRKAMMEELNQF